MAATPTPSGWRHKVSSVLLQAWDAAHGQVPPGMELAYASALEAVQPDGAGRVWLRVDGQVSPALLQAIEAAGGVPDPAPAQDGRLRCRLPLAALPELAQRADVRRLSLPIAPRTNSPR